MSSLDQEKGKRRTIFNLTPAFNLARDFNLGCQSCLLGSETTVNKCKRYDE